MAGLSDPNVVDVVGQDADGQYVVIMVEDRPWNADPAQPKQLREKISSYASFILNGNLAMHYPETADQPIRVQLDCAQEPTDEIAPIVDHARAQLDRLGIGLRVNVRSQRL